MFGSIHPIRRLAGLAVVAGAFAALVPVAQADTGFQGEHDAVDPVAQMQQARQAATFDGREWAREFSSRSPDVVERAARGGAARRKFPWGNALKPGGQHAMNTWQGVFPDRNSADDGFVGTAPVDAFAPNGYGLYNTTGNVWEWVADRFGALSGFQPATYAAALPIEPGVPRVQRGGSYLCHVSYCDRYHVHSRTRNDPDSSTGNCGFRVASF